METSASNRRTSADFIAQLRSIISLGLARWNSTKRGASQKVPSPSRNGQAYFALDILFRGIAGLQQIERRRFHPQGRAVDFFAFRGRPDTIDMTGKKNYAQRVLDLVDLAPQAH